MRILKYIRNTLISIGVLLTLIVGGGIAYTWYMGRNPVVPSVAEASAKEETVPVIKHVAAAANAPVGASVQSLTSPVIPGSNASITVKTTAGATCAITVVYDKTASKDSGLVSKTANDFGVVSWTWTVESSVPLGKWPVKVTCALGAKSAVVQGDLVVSKQVD